MSEVKYAAQLNAMDLGHTVRYVRKYRYGGQDREKVILLPILIRVQHHWDTRSTGKEVTTSLSYRKTKYSGIEYEHVSPLTEVEIADAN